MKYIGTAEDESYFDQGTVAYPGDIVYYIPEEKFYIYYDEGLGKPFGWKPFEPDKNAMIDLGLTEYEINKMVVAQLPSLITEAQLRKGKELIKEFTHRHITSVGYYMLLGRDINYYTVFEVCNEYEEKVEDIVIECLQNIGVIQYIDNSDDGLSVECWIKNDKGTFALYLFDYSEGVITCQ